jgi:hypothetical protein
MHSASKAFCKPLHQFATHVVFYPLKLIFIFTKQKTPSIIKTEVKEELKKLHNKHPHNLFSFNPSNFSTSQIGPWPPPLRFLNHTELDTRYDYSGRVISPSQRHLPTQDNTTCKHKRHTSMPRAAFEPAIPVTKQPQPYALYRAAAGIDNLFFIPYTITIIT